MAHDLAQGYVQTAPRLAALRFALYELCRVGLLREEHLCKHLRSRHRIRDVNLLDGVLRSNQETLHVVLRLQVQVDVRRVPRRAGLALNQRA